MLALPAMLATLHYCISLISCRTFIWDQTRSKDRHYIYFIKSKYGLRHLTLTLPGSNCVRFELTSSIYQEKCLPIQISLSSLWFLKDVPLAIGACNIAVNLALWLLIWPLGRALHQGCWQVCVCLQRNSRIALRTLISHHCLLSLLIPLTSSVSSYTITAIAPYQIRRHNQRHYPQVTISWCRHSPILQPLLGSHHHRVDYILVPDLTVKSLENIYYHRRCS